MIEVDLITEKELSETLRTARNDLFWQFCDTALWWENADTRDAKAAELRYSLSRSIDDVEDVILISYLELFESRQKRSDKATHRMKSPQPSNRVPTYDDRLREYQELKRQGWYKEDKA
jgi:hypothetical protein